MAAEQWVNLTVDETWLGDGPTRKAGMGPEVTMNVRFSKKARHTFHLTKEPDSANAAYSAKELAAVPVASWGNFSRRRYVTGDDGTLKVKVPVGVAGGDKYKFTAEDDKGNKSSVEVETRRLLYYQAVKMHGATVSAGTLRQFETHFWNEGEKLYVKMVEVNAGSRPIIGYVNVDPDDPGRMAIVREQARARWGRKNSPYCFVIVLVRKLCLFGDEEKTLPAATPGGVSTITTDQPLATVADPDVPFVQEVIWIPEGEFAIYFIDPDKVRMTGECTAAVDTSDLPRVPGRLSYRFRVIAGQLGGRSYGNTNLVIVATEYHNGNPKPASKVLHVVNHEVGHKIGMVPSAQSSYYSGRGHRGRHCYTGTALLPTFRDATLASRPSCVMFGDTRSSSHHFCNLCLSSLRKLDLRARSNPGLSTPF